MSALSVQALSKSFGALTVTDAVDLDIVSGELHAIIGPNGAGKTTLIDQLSGKLVPDRGHILHDGDDIARLPMAGRARRGIARSFQITSILARFTVLENAALAVQARSGSSFRFLGSVAKERDLNEEAMTALGRVGLADRAHRIAGTLSHGEKRQLEIAVALATRPRILLLDEPLAGTGREESALLVALMASLKGEHTIVLVEHDMDAVFQLADRVSVLAGGRLIATGIPEAIRADAAVRAAYLGEDA